MRRWLRHLRRDAYVAGRVLGDVNAVAKGPAAMARRAERKWLWKWFARLMRKAGF